jgi:hypothetical protein
MNGLLKADHRCVVTFFFRQINQTTHYRNALNASTAIRPIVNPMTVTSSDDT